MEFLLYKTVDKFFYVVYLLILIRIICSWLPINRDNRFLRVIYLFTEPILGPIRNMVNNSPLGGGMMLDFSPIIALFLMNIVKVVLFSLISLIF